jgi:hypothetical protein
MDLKSNRSFNIFFPICKVSKKKRKVLSENNNTGPRACRLTCTLLLSIFSVNTNKEKNNEQTIIHADCPVRGHKSSMSVEGVSNIGPTAWRRRPLHNLPEPAAGRGRRHRRRRGDRLVSGGRARASAGNTYEHLPRAPGDGLGEELVRCGDEPGLGDEADLAPRSMRVRRVLAARPGRTWEREEPCGVDAREQLRVRGVRLPASPVLS